jgi:hypothetical protein
MRRLALAAIGTVALRAALVGGNPIGERFASNVAVAQVAALAPCPQFPSPWPSPVANELVNWSFIESSIAAGTLRANNPLPSPAPEACRMINAPAVN